MIYLHVPFCKSRCIYCDFYSTVSSAGIRGQYVEALCRELEDRRSYLPSPKLRSVYWGGGTPSLLSLREIERVWTCIGYNYEVLPGAEITLEANPDDVTEEWARAVAQIGINRVSLGVQTFDDNLLAFLRRRHTGRQAVEAVECLVKSGIANVSIDLMYGLPRQTAEAFGRDVAQAFQLPVKHLSAYALSIEEDTPLSRLVRKGQARSADEETYRKEYETLLDMASRAGWEHYEISNFALPGHRAVHNSGYWCGMPYLGCGPGAHSYDGTCRRYNKPDLKAYLEGGSHIPHSEERLSTDERFNEQVFTSLRTCEGLDVESLYASFGKEAAVALLESAAPHLRGGLLEWKQGRLCVARKGLFVSDGVMSDLMRV